MTEQAKVPAIRFAGFTDPWEQRKLGELVTTTIGGGTPSTSNPAYWDGEIPWIQSSSVLEDTLFDVDIPKAITQKGLEESAAQIVPENSIAVVTHVGVGKLIYLPFQYSTSQDFISLCGLKGDARYTCYALWKRLQEDLHIVQGSAIKGITKEDLLEKNLPMPSVEEQAQIGVLFSQLDNLITLHQRKYDKLVILKKSMLEKMFPKDGESVPEIRFAGFTDPWEQRKFSEIVDVCSGRDYKHLDEGPIPVYGTGGYMTSVSEALSHNRDAIGIGRKGTIDKPYLLKAPFWTVDTLFYAIPKSDINLEFALCSFLNVDWKSKDESTGLPSLSKESINETVLSVPNVVEQNHLGNFFADLDRLITLHQRKLELLQNIKKSLLDKMFV